MLLSPISMIWSLLCANVTTSSQNKVAVCLTMVLKNSMQKIIPMLKSRLYLIRYMAAQNWPKKKFWNSNQPCLLSSVKWTGKKDGLNSSTTALSAITTPRCSNYWALTPVSTLSVNSPQPKQWLNSLTAWIPMANWLKQSFITWTHAQMKWLQLCWATSKMVLSREKFSLVRDGGSSTKRMVWKNKWTPCLCLVS